MDDHPKFTQIELRSDLVLLSPGYTLARVARDRGKKKRGMAAGGGTERPPSRPAPVRAESVGSSIYPLVIAVEGEADAAQGGLGFPEVPLGFEKVNAAPAPNTPTPVASPSTAGPKKNKKLVAAMAVATVERTSPITGPGRITVNSL
ncbi:Os04g0567500 [Oryza sativa Japonica Group]|uniref:Uncharacterized protein n=2 Tax=Oryza sativa subsp. japonica TaxID=39947 RepID=A0A8J8XJZ6_ORYSJ|nr:hypothetical protein OsJ_15816 [Oryza sativa Japonica Group]BAS90542.1 Os04g0567500 [Oryza sativa Japonica Group]